MWIGSEQGRMQESGHQVQSEKVRPLKIFTHTRKHSEIWIANIRALHGLL
jgi:hypothetical protein